MASPLSAPETLPYDAPATPASAAPHLRSCLVCRQRKIKCDRQQPCSGCSRSGCDCVYPSGRGRAPKRARARVDAQLSDKLARMEAIIKRLASENASQATALSARQEEQPVSPSPDPNQQSKPVSPSPPSAASVETQLSHLIIGQKKSYYVSNPLWATLAGEIDELREIITEPDDDDDDGPAVGSWPEAPSTDEGTNAALFGYRSVAHSLRPFHPSISQALEIFSAFTDNVAPLLRLFHMPTLSALYRDAIASTASLDKNTEALIFSIYYSAIMSMPSDQCMAVMGLPHEVATERYRFAVEQAIARADLLNTHSLVLLQAVVLFLSALRSHSDSRASWSLTCLIFHLAQTMGLHRDGTVFGLKPFDTEIRRRLWYHICILDSRASDHHGFGPLMYQASFDTRIPLNINDADLTPDMTEPPQERDEATDMTFTLVRCEAIRVAVKARLLSPDEPQSVAETSSVKAETSAKEQVELMQTLNSRLRDHYLPYCNPSSPIQLFSSLLIKLISVHFRLMIYYPLRRSRTAGLVRSTYPLDNQADHLPPTSISPPPAPPTTRTKATPTTASPSSQTTSLPTTIRPDMQTPTKSAGATATATASDVPDVLSRDELFLASVEILELCHQILTLPAMRKWTWYSRSHVQWHVVAFVLLEICSRPPSPMCERAWTCASAISRAWNSESYHMTQGLMWKSVQRLLARAKYVRELQALGVTPGGVKMKGNGRSSSAGGVGAGFGSSSSMPAQQATISPHWPANTAGSSAFLSTYNNENNIFRSPNRLLTHPPPISWPTLGTMDDINFTSGTTPDGLGSTPATTAGDDTFGQYAPPQQQQQQVQDPVVGAGGVFFTDTNDPFLEFLNMSDVPMDDILASVGVASGESGSGVGGMPGWPL